jgi:iron(III) transport system ATP-binding protein
MTLEAKDISVRLSENRVLDEVSFAIPAGSTAVVMGTSGAGKTTLLRTVAGLVAPFTGSIKFGDSTWNSPEICVNAEHRSAGMVFQDLALWPHMTANANVEVTLRALDRHERRVRIAEVFEALGISDLAKRYPAELSGGQQQRVAIARAFARRPKLALLDEPTSQLDSTMSEQVIGWIKKEQAEDVRILVVVTHSISCARSFADGTATSSRFRLHQGCLQPEL